MIDSLQRLGLFAAYQLTLAAGILLLPLALLTRRFGVTLPVKEFVGTVHDAYDRASA